MSDQILAPSFVFRFSVPVRPTKAKWKATGVQLDESYRIPSFQSLDGKREFADVRVAWTAKGLFFDFLVTGKLQTPWCRDTRLEDSDNIQVWIDTRDTHNIHRASRFCHRYLLMPSGGGSSKEQPLSMMLKINRAREESRSLNAEKIPIVAKTLSNGYRLSAFIPSQTMSGFDPDDQPRLGFTYAISDRELGCQSFSVGPEFPFAEDPSLWGTLDLQNE